MARVGTVDDRFQSYNVEMLEVTGGKFWRAYGPELDAILRQPQSAAARPGSDSGGDTPAGMDPRLYQYRPPIDLTNARLRKLANALAPRLRACQQHLGKYDSYFPDTDRAPTKPPAGFMGVLTRQQWKGVVDFSKAVDARIVTSFATGVGTRDASGMWTPVQAQRLLDYTKSIDGSIAAAEFMNEPTLAVTLRVFRIALSTSLVGQSAAYHVRSTSHEKESRLENKSQEEKRHRAEDAANFTRSLSSGMLWAKLMQIE